jgi:diacylglycerol kinase (ATP)
MKSTSTGLKKIFEALKNSLNGFRAAFATEEAFRIEVILCVILLPIALWLPVTVIEKLLLISALFGVIMAELVNTAIEVIIDRISDDYHDLSKKAKDIGSLIVLIALLYTGIIWGVILFTHISKYY